MKKIDTPISPLEFFTRIDRPIRCSEKGCERLTTWAYAEKDSGESENSDYLLSPLCFVHGLERKGNWPDLVELHEIISRFVIGMHEGQGEATVIASIDPEDAPGFLIYKREDFETEENWIWWQEMNAISAWSVSYTPDAGSEPVYFVVVWDAYASSFHLCTQEGTVQPPQIFEEDTEQEVKA
jgi:hypothetical protein